MTISMTWPQYKRRVVMVKGCPVRLSPMEMEIFLLLYMRRNRWVTIAEMISFIYPDPDLEPQWPAENLRALYCRMVKRVGSEYFMRGVKGRGYFMYG